MIRSCLEEEGGGEASRGEAGKRIPTGGSLVSSSEVAAQATHVWFDSDTSGAAMAATRRGRAARISERRGPNDGGAGSTEYMNQNQMAAAKWKNDSLRCSQQTRSVCLSVSSHAHCRASAPPPPFLSLSLSLSLMSPPRGYGGRHNHDAKGMRGDHAECARYPSRAIPPSDLFLDLDTVPSTTALPCCGRPLSPLTSPPPFPFPCLFPLLLSSTTSYVRRTTSPLSSHQRSNPSRHSAEILQAPQRALGGQAVHLGGCRLMRCDARRRLAAIRSTRDDRRRLARKP